MASSGEDDVFGGVEVPPAPTTVSSPAISTSEVAATADADVAKLERSAKFKMETAPSKRKQKTDKRKRRTDGNFIMTKVLIDGILDLQTSICKVLFYVGKEEEEEAMVASCDVRNTLLDMQKVASDLISLAFKSITVYDTLDPSVIISEFTTLAISAEGLRMPLLSLQHSKSVVLELYVMVVHVKKIVMLAIVNGVKKSKVAVSAEGSGACAGSTTTPTS